MRRAVIAVALILAGCGTAGAEKPLTVFAAASLTESFTELGKQIPGVRFSFASSATLAQQIDQGAPADVFASANTATMKIKGAKIFARNRLAIAVPKDNPAKIEDLRDLEHAKVALCAEQVPCGTAARKVLTGLAVRPVTLEPDVKATLTKVELGEVDAALVYRTDIKPAVTGIEFPEAKKAINDYPIAALSPEGKRFVDLVLSKKGRDVLGRHGFEVP